MKLKRSDGGYWHWCPGCKAAHPLPDGWKFDGNMESPTFSPSFKHTVNRKGEICHYVLTAGVLNYCEDCFHDLRNQKVPLPDIPEGEISW